MQSILSASLLIFSCSSLYFYFTKTKKMNLAFLVSSVTVISSLLMLEGSFITQNALGQDLFWTRWVFYTISCTLLMYTIAQLLKKSTAATVEMIYLTAFVMITGAFGGAFDGLYKWLFFGLGGVFYLMLLQKIFEGKKSKELSMITPFVILGWSVFPIIFILSPEGLSLISNIVAASIYLALDVYTKIYFYFRIAK